MLVDGDDMNEPIADAVRAILDGHVVLSRALAHAGHYPAIDVLQSVSRLVGEIVSPEVVRAGQRLRAALAALREKEDLIAIGAYSAGSRSGARRRPGASLRIEAFLRQPTVEPSDPEPLRRAADRTRRLAGALAGAHISGEVLEGEEVGAHEPETFDDPRANRGHRRSRRCT